MALPGIESEPAGAGGRRAWWSSWLGRLLAAVALPLALLWLAGLPGLAHLNRVVYDRMISLASFPPSPQLMLVAIDDYSLSQLGRWPWPRGVHAQLLERLAQAQVRGVLLDLFFVEPSRDAEQDGQLARAMRRLPVYLPLMPTAPGSQSESAPGFIAPLAALATQARGLGHANLLLDEDGIARSLYLREGPAGHVQPYVGALLAGRLPAAAAPGGPQAPARPGWERSGLLRLPFAGERGSYRTVPYVSVLRGEVPAELLRGRLVLVGVTAPGLGDRVPTPATGTRGGLPGLEVHATAIDNLLNGRHIAVLPPLAHAAWVFVPIWLTLCGLLALERNLLPATLVVAGACVLASVLAMEGWRLWLPPAEPVIGLLVLYLVGSWRKLERHFEVLRQRAQKLNEVPTRTFEMPQAPPPPAGAPPLGTLEALDRAIARLRSVHRLVDEAMRALPAAMLVCDDRGRIVSSNGEADCLLGDAAREHHPADALTPLRGLTLAGLLGRFRHGGAGLAPGTPEDEPLPPQHWLWGLHAEYATPRGRVFQLRAQSFSSDIGERIWVVVLPELTAERNAQRQREEWRRLLSHDLRSPQVTILSLLAGQEAGMEPAVAQAVRREAQRTLALAEGFMDLADAESGVYRFAPVHVGGLLMDARDQVWPYARDCGVALELRPGDAGDTTFEADGALLTRAVVNLLNNAVRHSPRGGRIDICLACLDSHDSVAGEAVCIGIRDEGSGMGAGALEALLAGSHGDGASAADAGRPPPVRSRGIGFAVVRAVVHRHRGHIEAASAPGAGSSFWLVLPVRQGER